jgi:hypothetical protein
MTERENQTFEVDSHSSAGNSDMMLLIALLAFIVFLAVAFLFIIFDTRGLWYPGWGPGGEGIRPMLNQLMK